MATIRPSPTVDLTGGDDHHDQREDLAVAVAPHAAERDQREVARVQHQLEAEQDHQRVAAGHHAGHADAEDERRQDDEPGDVHVPASCPGRWSRCSSAPPSACGRPRCLRASTTAPTAANSSRIDAASNATRNFWSSSAPIAPGEPKPAPVSAPCESSACERRAADRDRDLDEQRGREQRAPGRHARRGRADRLLGAADVGDDEHVEHHHRARVDDDLRRGEELGAQQQEQRRDPEQVHDEHQHRVERVADQHHAERAGDRARAGHEEDDVLEPHGPYSPSCRSGVRSGWSASSISLVKIRSERV